MDVTIFNIQKFSTEDGPGIRTTVFFKGCPMRCPWCHNPESLDYGREVVWHGGRCLNDRGCIQACPEQALSVGEKTRDGIVVNRERCTGCGECVDFCAASALEMHGRTLSVQELYDEVIRDVAFYETSEGGVTLSGGEPLAQPKAALRLLAMLREARIHTALDTCGAVNEWALREALGLVDLVLLDIKSTDPEQHQRLTGVSFDQVAVSARMVADSGLPVWIRTPVIPGYTADEGTIRGVARFVAETFDHCERHDLLAFSNLCSAKYEQLERPFALANVPLFDADTMQRLTEIAQAAGSVNAIWSGPTRVEESKTE